jgi:hypothetical protein
MRRMISVLAVVAVMAALMVVMAVPAFAVANENASCIGEAFSEAPPTLKGPAVSTLAQEGDFGDRVSTSAHNPRETDCQLEL